MALLVLMAGACTPQPDPVAYSDQDMHIAKDSPSGESLAFIPLLPASIEGHQARIDGVFAVRHGCPYLVTASGDGYLLAFMLRPVDVAPNGALAVAGNAIVPGQAIGAGGSEITGLAHSLTWERKPPARCAGGKVWAVVSLERR